MSGRLGTVRLRGYETAERERLDSEPGVTLRTEERGVCLFVGVRAFSGSGVLSVLHTCV